MYAQAAHRLRRSRRFPAELPVKLILESLFSSSAHTASTVDVSQEGTRVRTPVSLSPGQSIRIVPSEGLKRAIRGRIVWVSKIVAGPDGEAGIEFLPN